MWEAGVDGAKPGSIYMRALPKVKETYRQEYYEGKAMDRGRCSAWTNRPRYPTVSLTTS